MVEFDVLPENPDRSGRLVLAHDFAAASQPAWKPMLAAWSYA
jgi:hypothetical protein